MHMRTRASGFTLIELIVAIAILGIVMAIAIPSFTNIIQNDTIISVTNDFISSLNLARSEALMQDLPVSICATADNSYSACGTQWQLGWLIFVNPSGGNTAVTPLLKIETISNQNVTFTAPVNIITYNGTGMANASSGNLTFVIKSTGCTADAGRSVAISVTGRPVTSNVSCP